MAILWFVIMSSTKTDILCFLKEFLDPFLFDRNGKSHHQAMEEKKDRWILGAFPPSMPLQLYKVKKYISLCVVSSSSSSFSPDLSVGTRRGIQVTYKPGCRWLPTRWLEPFKGISLTTSAPCQRKCNPCHLKHCVRNAFVIHIGQNKNYLMKTFIVESVS